MPHSALQPLIDLHYTSVYNKMTNSCRNFSVPNAILYIKHLHYTLYCLTIQPPILYAAYSTTVGHREPGICLRAQGRVHCRVLSHTHTHSSQFKDSSQPTLLIPATNTAGIKPPTLCQTYNLFLSWWQRMCFKCGLI